MARLDIPMGVHLTVHSAEPQTADSDITYQYEQQRVVIGRGAGADVRLPHLTVSEIHAFIELRGDEYCIVDNNSTNGTRVNGKRLVPQRPKMLQDGDCAEVGRYFLTVRTQTVVATSSTAERTAELARRLIRQMLDSSEPAVGPPELVVLNGAEAGHRLAIAPAPSLMRVGRDPSCQLVLSDAEVSREHMEVISDLDGVLARNLDSKNGVIIGRQRITERRLRHGNELVLGETRVRFEDPAEASIQQLSGQSDQPLPLEPDRAGYTAWREQEGRQADRVDHAEAENAIAAGRQGSRPAFPAGAELLIYLLAAAILVLSVSGLVILLRAG